MESKASPKPIIQKLGLKENQKAVFLGIPKEIIKFVKPPLGVKPLSKFSTGTDFVLGFYESEKSLKSDLKKLPKCLVKTGMAWICWKKGKATDLSRDTIWNLAQDVGLDGVSSCAINESWSALKLMFPKDQRK